MELMMPVPDLAAISALTSSLKATSDIAQAMLGIRDAQLVREKAVELVAQIITAQQSALAAQAAQAELSDQKRDLEQKIMELEDWDREKAKYQLAEVAAGVFVYLSKPGVEPSEPAHKICANCYQQRRKSILQAFGRRHTAGHAVHLVCHACSADIIETFTSYPSRPTAPRGGTWRT